MKKAIVLCVAMTLVVFIAGCGQKGTAPSATIKRVTITKSGTPGGKPTLSLDPVSISISRGEEVEWVAAGGEDFVVSFGAKTPFGKRYFHENRGRSGQIRGPKDTYKYTVLIEGQELDPSVIIQD